MYGWPAYNRGDGFPQAQGIMSLVESGLYIWYLWIVRYHGRRERSGGNERGKGETKGEGEGKVEGKVGKVVKGKMVVSGFQAGVAVLVAHAAAVMTFSKTALYCKFFLFRFIPLLGCCPWIYFFFMSLVIVFIAFWEV